MKEISENRPAPAPGIANGELKWAGHMADDVGATFGPEPMATLTATANELVLAGARGHFRLPRTQISRVGRARMYPWMFSGIRIRHSLSNLPADLQFKPIQTHWRDVIARLKLLGYQTG